MTDYSSDTYDSDNDNWNMSEMYGTTRTANGIVIPVGSSWIDVSPTQAKFKVQKTGSPSGSVVIYAKIWADTNAGTGTVRETSTTTYTISDLSSGTENILTFTFAGTTSLAAHDTIGIYAEVTGGDTSNNIGTRAHYPNSSQNGTLISIALTSSWEQNTPLNTWFQMSDAVGPSPGSGGTRLPPPPLIARF